MYFLAQDGFPTANDKEGTGRWPGGGGREERVEGLFSIMRTNKMRVELNLCHSFCGNRFLITKNSSFNLVPWLYSGHFQCSYRYPLPVIRKELWWGCQYNANEQDACVIVFMLQFLW